MLVIEDDSKQPDTCYPDQFQWSRDMPIEESMMCSVTKNRQLSRRQWSVAWMQRL